VQYGIINVPVTDLRAEPESTSERRSQLLFGMAVEIGGKRNKFSRVTLTDKFWGWCRTGHIYQVPKETWDKYISRPKRKVKAETVLIKSGLGVPAYPFRLFFGTELVIRKHRGRIHFELPPGHVRAPIGKNNLQPIAGKNKSIVTGKRLVLTAARFLGVHYLWGGLTPNGYDCSGLVQIVYGFHGIKLPRDSKKQREVGLEVARADLRPGDLLFFPGHVAISCGGTEILHASAGRGMVSFDSLNPKAVNYRADLDRNYLLARRVL
jgi:hypothetical protein